MWIKTYIRRSDKKPACELCGQQFRISFTQPHKGLVGFLFSSQSPPLVHSIYLSLLYAGLYGLFLFAGEHHTKLAAFCVMVAVGVGASAALFYLIAVREVDKQVLVYYIIPTFTFAIVIFSQFMGYASLYYKWLSYPGISPEEDMEYKTFLKQLTWRSSVGVLLEGISSTSIVLNLALILCVSFVRFYNFLRHLRRNGGSLANVWMTAPDSTRATILGFLQVGIFVWFYVCGPTGKYVTSALYVIFVALVNWLLHSRFSQNIETGLCRLALIMGYGFVGTMLMGVTITHYLAQLADADLEANAPLSVPDQLAEMAVLQEAEQEALSQHAAAPVSDHADLTSGFFALHPTRLSHKMAGNFIRFFYDKNARNDHFEYWNQVFYVSFFLFQTLGIFAVAIWIHTRAVWDHFKDWQSARRQQQLVLLRDELLSKLHGMQLQQRSLVDSVRQNLPPRPGGEVDDVHAHLRRRQQLDRERRAHQDDIIAAEATMQRVQSNLGHLSDYEDSDELYGVPEQSEEGQQPDDKSDELVEPSEDSVGKEVEEDSTELEPTEVDDESRFVTSKTDKGKEKLEEPQEEESLEEKETERAEGDSTSREAEPLLANVTTTPTAAGEEAHGQQTTAVATAVAADDFDSRLQAGAREFVAGVRSIDDLVAHYLQERRTESQVTLFVQYLRMHLSPFTAPEKVRMVYATLAYLLLFHSVYLSLVVIDQDEVKKVWLRYVMDFVGMISILFFIHFNYLTGAPNHNNVNLNADPIPGNANANGNMGRNYGLLLIGHSVLYFILLFVWIVLQPATFFDPSLRLPHDEAGITDAPHADAGALEGDNATLFAADAFSQSVDASGGMALRERLFDALTRDQAAPHDPYALHSLKVMSLLIFLSLVEYGLIALGLTARRLVRIYRIWLDTGTGHFVVHDIAEPVINPAAAAAADVSPHAPLPPPPQHVEGGDREHVVGGGDDEVEEEDQRLRQRRATEVGTE